MFGQADAVDEVPKLVSGMVLGPLDKLCPSCKRVRARGQFRRDVKGKDGRHWCCREGEKPGRAAIAARRRAAPGGGYTRGDVMRLWVRQGGVCACGCGALLAHGYHVDHVVALARGGLNEAGNLQLLSPACNLRKGAK